MAFSDKGRIPVRPLDYNESDDGRLAQNNEMMVDYESGNVYVKDSTGKVHNIYSQEGVTDIVKKAISDNRTIVTDARVTLGEERNPTVQEAIADNDTRIAALEEESANHSKFFDKTTDNEINGKTLFKDVLRIDINNPNICGSELPTTGLQDGQIFFLLAND